VTNRLKAKKLSGFYKILFVAGLARIGAYEDIAGNAGKMLTPRYRLFRKS
jgi:hypothetical protein